jgi:hypothetical protein
MDYTKLFDQARTMIAADLAEMIAECDEMIDQIDRLDQELTFILEEN